MEKFILVVPSSDGEKFTLNKHYTNKLKNIGLPYYICDYNYSNIKYENICGILLTGGGDLDPKYSNAVNNDIKFIDTERDIFEIELLNEAYKRKIPTLAICRGLQAMNVAFGGTLNQHIDNHMQEEDRTIATHKITIDKSSMLYKILEKDEIEVNSIHHQSIKDLSSKFKIVASSIDVTPSSIEAIELIEEDLFFIGVQWHPEALYDDNSKRIFNSFANAIRKC